MQSIEYNYLSGRIKPIEIKVIDESGEPCELCDKYIGAVYVKWKCTRASVDGSSEKLNNKDSVICLSCANHIEYPELKTIQLY